MLQTGCNLGLPHFSNAQVQSWKLLHFVRETLGFVLRNHHLIIIICSKRRFTSISTDENIGKTMPDIPATMLIPKEERLKVKNEEFFIDEEAASSDVFGLKSDLNKNETDEDEIDIKCEVGKDEDSNESSAFVKPEFRAEVNTFILIFWFSSFRLF